VAIHPSTPETRRDLIISFQRQPNAHLGCCGDTISPISSVPSSRTRTTPDVMSSNELRPFPETASPVTEVLLQARTGDPRAMDRLIALVYDELRAMAHQKLGFEATGHTLQTTALVHEAYLKLVDQRRVDWQNRAHFFAVAAIAMRRILVHHAEARRAAKRGGASTPLPLDDALAIPGESSDDRLLALNEALERLEQFNERGARVVEYRFFGGLGYDDIATTMGLSAITVRRAWETARAWLRRELEIDLVDASK
jgi:RNA polymerase sigma factor (TIGR02999 family)